MKAKLKNLPDEKLEVFTLHLEDFNKAKVEEDELQVNDKMYDIARVKLSGDSVIVYTLHDAAEDNLLAFLDEVVKRPLREKQSTPAQILQFISLTFLPPGEHELSALQALTIAPSTNYVLIDFFCSRSIESPPPRS